jgi:hypothetical protein
MTRASKSIVIVLMVLFAFSIASADKEVKVGGQIFAQWYYDMSDTLDYSRSDVDFEDYSAFSVQRAYIYAKAKLSEKTWGKVTVDVNPDIGYIRLKYAFVNWKLLSQENINLSTRLGLQGTPWIAEMDAVWGRRYLEMTPTEQLGMETSADFGLSFGSKFGEEGKWGHARLAIFNGSSYEDPGDDNPTKDINLAVFLTPLNANPDFAKSKIGFQVYSGTLNSYVDSAQVKDDYKKTIISIMGNLQYRELFALGLEYDSYKSPQILDVTDRGFGGAWPDLSDNKVTAIALFGTLWFADLAENTPLLQTTNLFFRYMMVDPDADDHEIIPPGGINFETSANEFIFGVECEPVKGVAASLNYRAEKIKDIPLMTDDISNSYLYLNMLLAF